LNDRVWNSGSGSVAMAFIFFFSVLTGLFQGKAASALTPEAGRLYQMALKFQKTGNLEQAARSFEQAIRLDATVLSENDNGLSRLLHERYQKKLTERPDDPTSLEGMGFVSSSCDSDFATAMEYYSKALSHTTDEAGKSRLNGLIDSCKTHLGVSSKQSSSPDGSAQDQGSSAADPEKKNASSTAATFAAQQEEKVSQLTKTKEDLNGRISTLEEEVKSLEEEKKKNHRLFGSSSDRRYKRKEDAGEKTIAAKREKIDKFRNEIGKVESAIDRVSKGDLNATVEVDFGDSSEDTSDQDGEEEDPPETVNPEHSGENADPGES